MTGQNLYEILGVPPNATQEQIRKGYIQRTKQWHPDRFNQTRQKAEWELANERIKELNHAYGVLKDALARSQYDRNVRGNSAPPSAQTQPSAPPPPPVPKAPPHRRQAPPGEQMGILREGRGHVEELPTAVRQRISRRAEGENQAQFRIKLDGVWGRYAWALGLCLWIPMLLGEAAGREWPSGKFLLLLGITLGVAVWFGSLVDWIVRWHQTPFGCWLLVTPLYVIQTHLDVVRYWPLWKVADVYVQTDFNNGIYRHTTLQMVLGHRVENFRVPSEAACTALLAILRVYKQRIREAEAQGDRMYFFEEDDFREFDPRKTTTARRHGSWQTMAVYAVSFLLFGAVLTFATMKSRDGTWGDHRGPGRADLPAAKAVSAPMVPLAIDSYAGTNHFVRLSDAATGRTAMTFFVHGGEPLKIQVPLGDYRLRFASGTKWYGLQHYFGPQDTAYTTVANPLHFRALGPEVFSHRIHLNAMFGRQRVSKEEFESEPSKQ